MMKRVKPMARKIREIPQKYYRAIAALTAVILLAVTVGAVSATTVAIDIVDNGVTTRLYATTKDKEELLHLAGLDGQEIVGELGDFVNGQAQMNIYRPFTATVVDGDVPTTVSVLHTTVEETIAAAGITLGTHDTVNMDLAAYASAEPIVITRVTFATVEETEEIPYGSTEQPTASMTMGTSRVMSKGANGEKTMTYTVQYENGVEVSRTLVSSAVTKEPVPQTVYVGTAPVVVKTATISDLAVPADLQLDGNGIPINYKDVWTGMSAVAYYAKPGAGTASGIMKAIPGVVAVNPKVIPYGTKMYIVATDGTVYGYAIAADTGTSVCNGTVDLDLFMESLAECCSWGRKAVNVYFL